MVVEVELPLSNKQIDTLRELPKLEALVMAAAAILFGTIVAVTVSGGKGLESADDRTREEGMVEQRAARRSR